MDRCSACFRSSYPIPVSQEIEDCSGGLKMGCAKGNSELKQNPGTTPVALKHAVPQSPRGEAIQHTRLRPGVIWIGRKLEGQ